MSWSVAVSNVEKENLKNQLDKALDDQLATAAFDSWDDSVQAQQDFAKEIAQQIADSGTVGDGPFNASLTGHRKDEGDHSAPHMLYVSVNQVAGE